MRYALCFVSMLSVLSCSSVSTTNTNIEAIISENHLLKKKLILIERKNSILEEENIDYKKTIKDKNAQIETIKAELTALDHKYQNDTELWNKKYDNLSKKTKILEQESSEKINELTLLNKKIEAGFSEQIKKLNEEMKQKEELYAKELEKQKNSTSEVETKLLKEVEKVKKQLTDNKEAFFALDAQYKEASLKLSECDKNISKQEDTQNALKQKVSQQDKIITEKDVLINELQEKISKLEKQKKQK